MKTVTQRYINGRFDNSHRTEVLDIINPTNRTVIGRVTLDDKKDALDANHALTQRNGR